MHSGGIDHFCGEKPSPLSGLYATLLVFADVSHFARTYTGWIYTKAILSEKCCNPFHQCLEGAAWNQIFKGWYVTHCSPIATCSKDLVHKVNGWSCIDKLLFYEDDLLTPTSLRSEVISWHRKWCNVQQDARPDNFVGAAKQADGGFLFQRQKVVDNWVYAARRQLWGRKIVFLFSKD